ncbi:glycosyltransferase family 4 protein [Longispora sp. NPDC051575]|uniref:glycosyltransferase family 4 protein n=1 Tax=Longispora sp. NPDC051575 TaxID=3154943 RepID=UPI00341A605E
MTPETPTVPTGPLRVLILAWEYPPVMVGGLGRHVHALATQLAVAGHEVTVVTRHAPGLPVDEMRGGVRVVRAPEDPPPFPLATSSLLAWTMAFNHALTRAALRAAATAEFDVIHAHDWLVTHTAVTLTEHLGLPLVATIHATEAGRHQGWLPEEMNRCIHAVEWWLAREASRVLVCSEYMKWEVTRLLELHDAAVEVIPNGVDDRRWRAPRKAVERARESYTAHDGPLVVYAGRLVYEKGVQDLISALPVLRDRHPGLRLVIAGDGPHRPELADLCARLGQDVEFCGFMEEVELAALLAVADAVVVPSLYEPFGMVALEASAAGAPLAAAATGGLLAIVQHGRTGLAFGPGDPAALADAVTRLIEDPKAAKRMVAKARAMIRKNYLWPTIAATTAQAYAAAIDEASVLSPRVPPIGERPPIVVPEGNLLALTTTP